MPKLEIHLQHFGYSVQTIKTLSFSKNLNHAGFNILGQTDSESIALIQQTDTKGILTF